MSEEGLRLYEISADVLLLHFTTGNVVEVVDGIPPGAELVDTGYRPDLDSYYMTVAHEDFDCTSRGGNISRGEIQVEEVDEDSSLA